MVKDLLKLYHSHRANCCNCGCSLESDNSLGSVFILDYNGNFYCMNCDNIFEEGDERIFEAEFYESNTVKVAVSFLEWLRDMEYYSIEDVHADIEETIEDFEELEIKIPRLFNLLRDLSDR